MSSIGSTFSQPGWPVSAPSLDQARYVVEQAQHAPHHGAPNPISVIVPGFYPVTSAGQFLQHTPHGAFKGEGMIRFLQHVLTHVSGEVGWYWTMPAATSRRPSRPSLQVQADRTQRFHHFDLPILIGTADSPGRDKITLKRSCPRFSVVAAKVST
jgi:hypothetical protein